MTADQVKRRLHQQGKTITEWAAEHGYSRGDVYRVLNGQVKAKYGKGYEIAVKLGLKTSNIAA
ncbi:DNA-binding protein [Salmonella enterica]|uniref:DNA-binding protein n=1 Tax=Salmonella enterica TaxID=28901 RepID=UPI000241359A|nr:DNA-binding protein [Salmonella enterica]ECC9293038.1 DNA-binding protein [Salmonella enterica subsp. salamae]EAQ6128993.1 DNA-binding protein [Salmonella enterica]EAX3607318.1 DNA-binding protein [Salmonella enterica]EGW6279330.1 DNA-binding protein [Salmonella enterica]EGX3931518.1 DNA-binding protein [Salmonella enterica]